MKKLILLTVLTVLLTGCNSINNIDKGKTKTIVEHIEYQNDGKTAKSKTITTTTIENDKQEKDNGFSLGTEGLGTYSIVRDISFM